MSHDANTVKDAVQAIAKNEDLLTEVLRFIRSTCPQAIGEDDDELVLNFDLCTVEQLRDVDEFVAQATFRNFFHNLASDKQTQLLVVIQRTVPDAIEDDSLNVSKLPLDFVKRTVNPKIPAVEKRVVVAKRAADEKVVVAKRAADEKVVVAKRAPDETVIVAKRVPGDKRSSLVGVRSLQQSMVDQQKRIDTILAQLKDEVNEMDRLKRSYYGDMESDSIVDSTVESDSRDESSDYEKD